jgi:hypothetical protein
VRLAPSFTQLSARIRHHGAVALPPAPPEWPTEPPLEPPAHPPTAVLTGPPIAPDPAPASASGAPPPDRPSRARTAISVAVLTVGALLLSAANVEAWADSVAHDPDTYAEASVLDLEDGGLAALVETRLTEVILGWADIETLVGDTLPGPLGALGGPAEDLARTTLEEAIGAVLTQEPVAGQIADIEAAADQELVLLLFTESEWFHLDGTTVVLDLDPLVQSVIDRIDEAIPELLSDLIPGFTAATLVPDEIDGGDLEVSVGEVPALTAAMQEIDDLGGARSLAIAGAAFLVLGVAIARRRLRAVAVAGAVVAGVAVLSLAVIWANGGPIVPSTDAIEAVAGSALVDLDGAALASRTLAMAAAAAAIGLAAMAVSALVPDPAARAEARTDS